METKEKINKLTDKAFSRLVIMSIFAILVCIICLCASTWAWFTESLPSSNNVIVAASDCKLSVSVEKDGTGVAAADMENTSTVVLEAGEYLVTMTLPKDSSSGYLVISTADAEYYTEYLERHDNEDPRVISFVLCIEAEQEITFTSKWGIHSENCDVADGETLNIQ